MNEKRVVWILGAGFSRPLGAPLLQDFFSKALEDKLIAKLRAAQSPEPGTWTAAFIESIKGLRGLYSGGLDEIYKDAAFARGPWADAEEFLEYLDLASSGDEGARELLRPTIKAGRADPYGGRTGFDVLARDARRYLALACHHFIADEGAIAALERWAPYVRWSKQLKPHDFVVSFNYDTVVELVARRYISVFAPGALPERSRDDSFREADNESPTLIKLHGSTSWVQPAVDGLLYEKRVPWEAIQNGDGFALAGPGPDKLQWSTGPFKMHWTLAGNVLRQADAIVVVGYRMPETDAYARRRLTEAIAQNPKKPATRVVLGPRRDEHVERLCALIRWACNDDGQVSHEPLWAQDFLAVFDRDRLFER